MSTHQMQRTLFDNGTISLGEGGGGIMSSRSGLEIIVVIVSNRNDFKATFNFKVGRLSFDISPGHGLYSENLC